MAAAASASPAAILKDAGLFALVAFGLCVPIVSHRTDLGADGLELTPRWGLVAGLCAAIFAVRLVQRLVLERRAARAVLTPSPHQATEPVGPSRTPGSPHRVLACRASACRSSSALPCSCP